MVGPLYQRISFSPYLEEWDIRIKGYNPLPSVWSPIFVIRPPGFGVDGGIFSRKTSNSG
jgi:hypothetical protein